MKKTLCVLVVASLAACGSEAPEETSDEYAAETAVTGKDDALFDQIIFGEFVNPMPEPGTFTTLQLTEVLRSELPAPHFEGRYSLTEDLGGGETRTSEGAFNVFRFDGEDWIRFQDDDGSQGSSEDKYSWSADEGSLIFQGVSSGTKLENSASYRSLYGSVGR